MKKSNACQRNDQLLRKMLENGERLTAIARAVGTNRTRVQEYIALHSIPHKPFETRNPMDKNGRWKGGRIIVKDGYALICMPDHPRANRHNYVREHRLVMEAHLGRYLEHGEVVHHKNGDKLDNRIENLELFERNSLHLAKELLGHVPNWTEDGKRRIREGTLQRVIRQRTSTQKV